MELRGKNRKKPSEKLKLSKEQKIRSVTDLCNSDDLGLAFGSITELKQKTQDALINADSYLQQLDKTLDAIALDMTSEADTKRMRIIKEKNHVKQAKSDINNDLGKIETIEKTFQKVCTQLPVKPKRFFSRKSKK